MLVTELGIVRVPLNPVHHASALLPMVVIELGIVTPSNPPQPLNTPTLRLVRELGITRVPVNPPQRLNASDPILVTEVGIVRVPPNPVQRSNALLPIVNDDVEIAEITRLENPEQYKNA